MRRVVTDRDKRLNSVTGERAAQVAWFGGGMCRQVAGCERMLPMAASVFVCFGLLPATYFLAPAEPALEPFDLADVRLLPGPLLDAQERNTEYLLSLDPDRLLYTYRVNAGLPAPGEPLGGWEAPDVEVRGYFQGHYLSALAMGYRSTGDPRLKERLDLMVSELAKCQEKLGGEYLCAFPEDRWDRLEAMEQPPGALYYAAHKVMAGLLDAYQLCGNRQALEVLTRLVAYFKRRIDPIAVGQWDRILEIEFGGMSDVLHNLYAVTGDRDHHALADRFNHEVFLGPLAMAHDNLTGLHGNTQIPKILGACRHYELTGDERYREAAEFFWKTVVETRTYATGGTTAYERWGEPNRMAGTENQDPHETCKTHNMLKVTRHLFCWSPELRYADYYEQAFLNGILGTQNPNDGQFIYYVFLGPGATKQWGTAYGSFWCCYGTGVESFAKLADSVYFHNREDLYVNLFVPTRLTWGEKGATVTQTTGFPEEQGTTLTVGCERPTRLRLHVRVPAWVGRRATISVNGEVLERGPKPGFHTIDRTFHDGDRVTLALPMSLSSVALPGDPGTLAFRYGPLVLASVGEQPVPAVPAARAGALGRYTATEATDPATLLEPVPGEQLRFHLRGDPEGVTFIPINRVVDEVYQVYRPVVRAGTSRHRELVDEEEAARSFAARVIDEVLPLADDEVDAHKLEGESTDAGSGPSATHWRHAVWPGWWSWQLAVVPDQPNVLLVTLWGGDYGKRSFDVEVEGRTLGTITLDRDKPGCFFDHEYAIPEDLTNGKGRVTVRFRPHVDNVAGGVFYCATLKAR